MRTKLGAFLCLLLGATVHAAQGLPRESPVPGGIAIIPLTSDSEPPPEVRYENNRVMVLRHDGKWRAVVGLPLTVAPGPQVITTHNSQGMTEKHAFLVHPKEYAEQRLKLKDRRMVEPTDADLMRIEREQKLVQSLFLSWTDESIASLQFRLPVRGRISSVFGLRRYFNEQPRLPHSGIDIAAPIGTPVVAPLDGTVMETGVYFFNGKTVFINHGQGLISMLNHLSRITVERGVYVRQGQKLGEVGMSGRVTGPHLHWTISLNNSRIDPALFVPEITGGGKK
ncbi:MAG TPA: peptidoglycan DD-metalloendopeptidase family protein [Sulfuricaulis sp.]|nr:peptidoglycan DD-metalloendopeptidase family protein [Sulfuricaulis sp.]